MRFNVGKHNNSIKVFIFFAILACASCKKDFLQVIDKTQLTRQGYVVDLQTTGDYLSGIYVNLATSFYNDYSVIYPEIIADNIKPLTGISSFQAHYSWKQLADESGSQRLNPNDDNINGLWLAGYRIIRDCSFVIDEVDKYRNENAAKADDIKGQAHAIRALVHSVLVNAFAQAYNFSPEGTHPGIPYIKSSDLSQPVTRISVKEVYEEIAADLHDAIRLMPAAKGKPIVFSQYAAKALLARINLFRDDYSAAKQFAKEVIDVVPLMDLPDYPAKLFTGEETEALFQLPPSDPGADPNAGSYYTGFAGQRFETPLFIFAASNDLALLLKEDDKDVRSSWVTADGSNWKITKYPRNVIPGFGQPAASYYQTIIRSSEMYLIMAESYAKLGMEDSARTFLDLIRRRGNHELPASIVEGAALLESIYKERRKEMCFEGFRMFDLLHQQKGVDRTDAADPGTGKLPYPSEHAIAPVPLQDVRLSALIQNSGYAK